MKLLPRLLPLALATLCLGAQAAAVSGAQFVNGLTLEGGMTDASGDAGVGARMGYFSDLYFDRTRNEWWSLSDRGPGGGLLSYETRAQRFKLDIAADGRISNFQVLSTVKFSAGGLAMNGMSPGAGNPLGLAFDPEGLVVNAKSGNLLVSDEYGPSLVEFDRDGHLLRRFETPANLLPLNGATGANNFDSDTGNSAGKRSNRGFEGLAISPDGRYSYAMLQSAMLDEGGGDGQYTRIVKFDNESGQAVAQYAYKLDSAAQGRGISALVALGEARFLVLERNNRGIGVGATLTPADKAVYEIDLSSAVDVTHAHLPASGAFAGAVQKVAKVMDLDVDTLAALGKRSPEKWEGLAVGPQLADGRYLMLAGTDNDYSVTQSGSGTQFDVYFRFSDLDPYASSIQCPIGTKTGGFKTSNKASIALDADYALLPGVLHAYAADIKGYVAPVSAPASLALVLLALPFVAGRRRRE